MELVNAAFITLAFLGAFFFTAKSIYHMYYVVTNVKGKHAYLLGAFLLFMPSQFNEKGNRHRNALAQTLVIVIACWVILFFTGVLDK